ncbi:MAG TPA: indole-3-glycerol phosphate synthase TrpC [Ilumatobacteraceae bacterium]|nr:indole-3-glycerol phosphate synthase TrpC [Ilumatobacteraceae bacterium]
MATYLDRIVARHREVAATDDRPLGALIERAASAAPIRPFGTALRRASEHGELAVISEIKRRSPSKGALNVGLDPAEMAQRYAAGGAAAMSVLTDVEFFGGSVADLQAARAAVTLPVLRKDFTVSARDVCDARLMGADCVLLIAAALGRDELVALHRIADEIGIDVLVEIHDEPELDVALASGATIVGVNQRDLVSFQVDHDRAVRMAAVIPDDVVKVAESGVRGADDARSLQAAGYHAVLVGETLVTAADPAATIGALRGVA